MVYTISGHPKHLKGEHNIDFYQQVASIIYSKLSRLSTMLKLPKEQHFILPLPGQ